MKKLFGARLKAVLELDVTDAVAHIDRRPQRLRKALHALEDAVCGMSVGRKRPAALPVWPEVPKINGVEQNLAEALILEAAKTWDAFPKQTISGMAFGVTTRTRIQKIRRRRL